MPDFADAECLVEGIEAPPDSEETRPESLPVVVGSGQRATLRIFPLGHMNYFRYDRRAWAPRRVAAVAEITVPAGPIWQNVDYKSLTLSLQVNGKFRQFPIEVWRLRENSQN